MRIAIIGGNSDDERHLGRLAEKAGHVPVFVRPRPGMNGANEALGASGAGPTNTLERVLELLSREVPDEHGPLASRSPQPLRALVFEAVDRADAAGRVLSAVRRDPYFERVGTLLIVRAELAGALSLPGGFDDFVLYPCGVDELVIRVRALGPRRGRFGAGAFADDTGLVVDETSRDVIVEGRTVQLTAREFALFTYLCEWRGKVLSREHLLARVWGSRYSGGRRTVDIHVRRLRAKLGASLAIETLRGSGYRLRRDPPSAEPASQLLPKAFSNELTPAYAAQRSSAYPAQIPEPFSKVS
jgi:DNA-binding winged helix-turn-helix (wHTH) protein